MLKSGIKHKFKNSEYLELLNEIDCEDIDNLCLICYSDNDARSLKLKCTHEFHTDCLEKSLKNKYVKECPYCRNSLNLLDYKSTCAKKIITGKNAGEPCNKLCYNTINLCKIHIKQHVKQINKETELVNNKINSCTAILKTGVNKGKQCTSTGTNGYCKRHLVKQILTSTQTSTQTNI